MSIVPTSPAISTAGSTSPHDFDLTGQARLRVATDNPGSPNIQAGLARYPIYATYGGTFGFDQHFNRLQVSAGGTVDRTDYQNSKLTDGSFASNDDRNFTQYGGVGRVSYEVLPGLKPFAEAEGDTRVHDLQVDRSGFARDSNGGYVKAGSSFEFTRLLTGEVAVGWSERTYVDPRLNRLQGLLTSGSLIWTVTPLTTAKFIADTQINETTLPATSGVLVHTYAFEVDHDFRRWLTAIGKFTYGTYDYQGDFRKDKTYSIEGDLIYKMTRNLWIKGSLRHDILESNVPLAGSQATVVLLGVRLQNSLRRHCERSEAIQKISPLKVLDCFVAGAPRNDAISRSRGADASEFCETRVLEKQEGAGNDGRWPHPQASWAEKEECPQVSTGTPTRPAFPAQWF